MTSLFIGFGVLFFGFMILNLGLRVAHFGLKYLIMFSFLGGFGYSAYQNFTPEKPKTTIEQATEGKELHRCEVLRVTKFSPSKIHIFYNDQEYEVEGECTVWQSNLIGVSQGNKYIFFLTTEPFKEEYHGDQAANRG